jgi:hypothetical protein
MKARTRLSAQFMPTAASSRFSGCGAIVAKPIRNPAAVTALFVLND